ncbi:MAG: type III pantothenate kinase [Peptoniphilaceae bacterium]|nr:type III pantothenate kinase [Peptoniphilaceae bacterium]MDY6019049.1 type III pantothenate kinase [Anaerococcus sp.]
MLLVVDIGNSNTVIGVYDKDDLIGRFRVTTRDRITSDEILGVLYNTLNIKNIDKDLIEDSIISSVVPDVLYAWQSAIVKFFGREAMIVGVGTKTGIEIKYDNPKTVGADRIVDAVAAFYKYGGPCIVVDLGTASTFDVISPNGQYLGGSIAPGIKVALDALVEGTAQLPTIELHDPETAIARNTPEAINAGMIYGYIGLIDGIIRRLLDEIKEKCGVDEQDVKIISTGGYSELLASESKYIDIIEGNLTLEGLKIIYERTSSR